MKRRRMRRITLDLDERARIDAVFLAMAGDPAYLAEMQATERVWAPASDAAGRLIDQDER